MKFIKSADSSQGQSYLLDSLRAQLNRGKVVWLVTGGSNIPIEVEILNSLEDNLTSNLKMLLTDERYGPKGHRDSNYTQLVSSGLKLKSANFPDILDQNLAIEETAKWYAELFNNFSSNSDYIIAQFGIGDDGHIAGILPNSPVIKTDQTVAFYETGPFKRITLSLNAIKRINQAVVLCYGGNKKRALERLVGDKDSLESLPSLILKEIPDVTVYNDQIEGK